MAFYGFLDSLFNKKPEMSRPHDYMSYTLLCRHEPHYILIITFTVRKYGLFVDSEQVKLTNNVVVRSIE
jgi:hypothetical protein